MIELFERTELFFSTTIKLSIDTIDSLHTLDAPPAEVSADDLLAGQKTEVLTEQGEIPPSAPPVLPPEKKRAKK